MRSLSREHNGEVTVTRPALKIGRYAVDLECNPETMRMIAFDDEHPRSLQLYRVDPATVGAAVRMLAEEDLADHLDLNFGCPVPTD